MIVIVVMVAAVYLNKQKCLKKQKNKQQQQQTNKLIYKNNKCIGDGDRSQPEGASDGYLGYWVTASPFANKYK